MEEPLIWEKRFFDSHAHLDWPDFQGELPQVIGRALSGTLWGMLSIGTSVESSARTVEIAQKFSGVYAAVGVHPHEAKGMVPEDLNRLADLALEDKVVAIGEVGLDFYRNYSPRDAQIKAFKEQIGLARELKMPLVIHVREAQDDLLHILKRSGASQVGGVFHCFSGDATFAREAMRLNFYISFAGNLTYRNAEALREAATSVPIERTLIETDAPFLTPEPHRGKRNEPSLVTITALTLAEIHGISPEDVARTTSLNARELFKIGEPQDRAKIAYKIRDSLYLNITNECTLGCIFCAKNKSYTVKGHNLLLSREPSFEEIMEAVGDPTIHKEVVFCGFGEPLLRLDMVKRLARCLKEKGALIRVNTDGLANLVHGRNIIPELVGIVDCVSVSLNADTAEKYARYCPSSYGAAAYDAIREFIREAARAIPEVIATVVTLPRVDIAACRRIAEDLGAIFRVRIYHQVG